MPQQPGQQITWEVMVGSGEAFGLADTLAAVTTSNSLRVLVVDIFGRGAWVRVGYCSRVSKVSVLCR
jgi:hypothetical protein